MGTRPREAAALGAGGGNHSHFINIDEFALGGLPSEERQRIATLFHDIKLSQGKYPASF